MTTIWKFPLELTDRQNVQMPVGAEVLSAQMQGQQLCLWAKVPYKLGNFTDQSENRIFEIFGTGHPMAEAARKFIGTVQEGPYVWHVFERQP